MTRTRPASSWAKVRPGWVGQPSVPARPGRRTANTRNGPCPSSKSGRRPWLRTNQSHVSCRSGAIEDEPTNPVTSVVSTRTS